MAQNTKVVFYREQSGRVPIEKWLTDLPRRHYAKCLSSIRRLRQLGNLLRHPHAHALGDGICELRPRYGRVRYRILYFWHSEGTVVISHGFVKKTAAVPQREIQRALDRKRLFEQNPDLHTQEMPNA
ncbi:MAG: type II toxin-antitoxin system RelE/ParE family toxin [Candidatus Poribacteria bacterium]|nr:type II toxin-antitoxin system RelE/ParE family toxin [Candidatus Poribacteria bacterium]